jgi:hypothetical protein
MMGLAWVVRCRARLEDVACFDGDPTSRPPLQDGTYHVGEGGGPGTVICDACYVASLPFACDPDLAVEAYRRALVTLRATGPATLPGMLAGALAVLDRRAAGDPAVAAAMADMARREVARRAALQ